jgi:hypothetical protein
VKCYAAVVCVVHLGLVAWCSTYQSPTVDEPAHLAAGLSHIEYGRFDLYRVNPPLVRFIASWPVSLAGAATDWSHLDPDFRAELLAGDDFLRANGEHAIGYFRLARWACLPLTLAGALGCYWWARSAFGEFSGCIALTLWAFCPNIVGHASLITPDVGAASIGVWAGFTYWRWLREPSWGKALLAGFALGLTELTKTTWIVLFAIWPVVWLVSAWRQPRREVLRRTGQLAAIGFIALYLINLGYGFAGTCRPLGEYRFSSRLFGGPSADLARPWPPRFNRFAGTPAARIPIPLPADYSLGIDSQRADFERGFMSYLAGQWKWGGWWYYYLYAMAVKVPLGTLSMLGLAVLWQCIGRLPVRPADLVLICPAVGLVVFVSSQTGFGHHMRYVLPAFPFFFVYASQAALMPRLAHKLLVSALAACTALSTLSCYPYELSYFNELAGGPRHGARHLLNSNIDWGQDLLRLRDWLAGHPEALPLGIACTGTTVDYLLPENDVRPVPTQPQPGWYALSINELHQYTHAYAYFLRLPPVAQVGSTIYIYHLTKEDIAKLPPRPDAW